MAEAAADTSKGMTKADQILSKLDSIGSRVNSIEKRQDAFADASKRKDGDLALEVKPKDNEEVVGGEKDPAKDDGKKKSDATITVSDAKRKDGGGGFQLEGNEGKDPPKDKDWDKKDSKKADASKRADRDKDEDTSVSNVTKGSGDSAAADAKKRADWDDDDKDKDDSKADARADAFASMAARLKALEERHTMPEEAMAEFTNAQAFADEAYQMHSKRAPASLPGKSLAVYKRRLVTPLRKFSSQWGDVKMTDLPDAAFVNIEKMIYSDAIAAAHNPTDLEPGEQRKVVKTDPDTGMKQILWYGPESFIKGLGRPGRRVVSFLNRNQQPI